jgi:hypothetical protein
MAAVAQMPMIFAQKERARRDTLLLTTVLIAVAAAAAGTARSEPLEPAVRSGARLPDAGDLAVALDLAGAYVPRVGGLTEGATGALQGTLTWNYAPWERLGLFGAHMAGGMWWDNLRLNMVGHEIGVRFAALEHMAFEAAYLTHRVDRFWVDDFESNPGGVIDRGLELGTWFRIEPHRRLVIEPHLVGRVFEVYQDTQGVTGLGVRVTVSPADGHALVLGLEVLRVIRAQPRTGVDPVTWNVLGGVKWRARVTDGWGIQVGVRVSTHLLVGEVPMLELKRSMIDEPMALGSLGVYFSI